MEIKDEVKKIYLKLKYKKKCKIFNISDTMLEGLLERLNMEEVIGILEVINNSKNKEQFRSNIVEFCKNRKSIYITYLFLFGNVTGNYSIFDNSNPFENSYNYDNFKENNYDTTLKALREGFYEYLLMNNKLKNNFLIDEKGNYNYTLDLDKKLCLEIYDEAIKGDVNYNDLKRFYCYSIVRRYISNLVGVYGKDIIEKELDFIFYDLNGEKKLPLSDRRKEYFKLSKLNDKQKYEITNLDKLISKLKIINNKESMELLDRISKIENKEESISEIDDIYMEYEIILREDILSYLYIPREDYTIVDDYRNLKPQLIHMFIRDAEKFRESIQNGIVEDIIKKRKDKNNVSSILDANEQKEYEKRMGLANDMLDPTIVNYTFDGREFVYSDKNGFNYYHSDTSNQISASIYSENYYLNHFIPWCIGIGFNRENVVPEAIVMSSKEYLTTNMGLTNLEYDERCEFELMSSTYSELISNDGKSEVVLFRRNIDYDTKASYVFITIDSSDKKRSEEFIINAKKMTDKNNLKLVIYDLYKIKKSYEECLEKNQNIENEQNNHKIR